MNTKAKEGLQTSEFTCTKFQLRISDLWPQTQLWHFALSHAVMFRLLTKVMPSWILFLVHWKSLTNVYFNYTDFLYSPFSRCFASRTVLTLICTSGSTSYFVFKPVHMSGKSQTIGDFTVSHPSRYRFCRLMKIRNRRYPDGLKWSGTNLENRDSFYFPDASQMSAMVGDRSRQMKTQICTVGDWY